jgi:hypothetical protein
MPKVALYACYSTDNQNVVSIEDQFRICRACGQGALASRRYLITPPLSLVLVSLSGRASDRCCRTPSVAGSTLCSPGAAGLQMPILVRVSLETPHTPCGSDRPRRDSRQHNRITLGGLSRPTFATKSVRNGPAAMSAARSLSGESGHGAGSLIRSANELEAENGVRTRLLLAGQQRPRLARA